MIKPKLNDEGFLIDHNQWDENIAKALAQQENIVLTSAHFRLLHSARKYYQLFDLEPEMRPFLKWLKQNNASTENISSMSILQYFPGSSTKLLCKIAGLPKPKSCL